MSSGISFLSQNLSGETVSITFTANTGSTIIDYGEVTMPASLVTDYYYGSYDFYVSRYDTNYSYTINEPVTGFAYNFIVEPYSVPSIGNMIISNNNGGGGAGSTNPNILSTATQLDGFYWNTIDIDGVNRADYFNEFVGKSVTITLSQNRNTVIYSGNTGGSSPTEYTFTTWNSDTEGEGFTFRAGSDVAENAVILQSSPLDWVVGEPVYVSVVVNS